MIVIVDYGCGNLGSVKNMIKKIGFNSYISSDIDIINKATKIILPGVGSFDTSMQNVKLLNLYDVLNKKACVEKIPILGICLGMQLMTNGSEEENEKGLSWVDANVCKFSSENSQVKIPHMGWNFVELKKNTPISSDFQEYSKFYFVHSYFVKLNNNDDVLFETEYGNNFVSGLESNFILKKVINLD